MNDPERARRRPHASRQKRTDALLLRLDAAIADARRLHAALTDITEHSTIRGVASFWPRRLG